MNLHVTETSKEDGVAIVRLSRPGRGNSWTKRMNEEYRWLMASHDADPEVRVIVVTGAGRRFASAPISRRSITTSTQNRIMWKAPTHRRCHNRDMVCVRNSITRWSGTGVCKSL